MHVSKGFKLLDKRAVLGSSASSVVEWQASLPTAATLGQKSKTELQCIICLLHKVQCFMMILATDKTDYRTCVIIYDNFMCQNYCFQAIMAYRYCILLEMTVIILMGRK